MSTCVATRPVAFAPSLLTVMLLPPLSLLGATPRGLPDTGWPLDTSSSRTSSPPHGPMTRARAQAIQQEVNSLLSTYTFNTSLDRMLPHASALCVIRYQAHQGTEEEEGTLLTHQGTGEEEGTLLTEETAQGRHCHHLQADTAAQSTLELPAESARHCRPEHPGTAGPGSPTLPA
jgi:hypothetical protein